MALAAAAWSGMCIVTFVFAVTTSSLDYRAFFRRLLGRFWPIFDVAYLVSTVVVLSVFGAAAGAIGAAVFGWPLITGSVCLLLGIVLAATWGSESVERVFKYVTVLLYSVYGLFLVFGFAHFGGRIARNLSEAGPGNGWAVSGLTYAGYNIIGAVVILPVLRHLKTRKDAIIAGALCGPLAMLPAVALFLCIVAYDRQIGAQVLPSDFLLAQMHMPIFAIVFQIMIFAALLESGTGMVHAVNERIGAVFRDRGKLLSPGGRAALTGTLLLSSTFLAARFGLVSLVAKGYRFLACLLLGVYVVPLLVRALRGLHPASEKPAVRQPQ